MSASPKANGSAPIGAGSMKQVTGPLGWFHIRRNSLAPSMSGSHPQRSRDFGSVIVTSLRIRPTSCSRPDLSRRLPLPGRAELDLLLVRGAADQPLHID